MLFGKIKHLSALDRVLESLAAAGFCISAFKSSLDFLRIVMCFEEEDEVMGVYFPNELVVPTNQFLKKKKKILKDSRELKWKCVCQHCFSN